VRVVGIKNPLTPFLSLFQFFFPLAQERKGVPLLSYVVFFPFSSLLYWSRVRDLPWRIEFLYWISTGMEAPSSSCPPGVGF